MKNSLTTTVITMLQSAMLRPRMIQLGQSTEKTWERSAFEAQCSSSQRIWK